MSSSQVGKFAFILDDRLSRERLHLLTQLINALRRMGQIDLLKATTTEDEILQKLETIPYRLILSPWHKYLSWAKLEAFHNQNKTSGFATAGYFADQMYTETMPEPIKTPRSVLLDFHYLSPTESISLIRTLLDEKKRTGIRPLLVPETPIYTEDWLVGQPPGQRSEIILNLPEVETHDWHIRANSLRICMMALWSLIYEGSSIDKGLTQSTAAGQVAAYFQVAADKNCLLLRLCFTRPGWKLDDAKQFFWPKPETPSTPVQLLHRFADLIRVHPIGNGSDLELVVGFYRSSTAEKAPNQLHTFLIEPVIPQAIIEVPTEKPGSESPHLKYLPTHHYRPQPQQRDQIQLDEYKKREKLLIEVTSKYKDLKKIIDEKDETIKFLKRGGVGSAKPMDPPDGEMLLTAFQERYFDLEYNIEKLRTEFNSLTFDGTQPNPQKINAVKNKMDALILEEQALISKLSETIKLLRDSKIKNQKVS